MHLSFIYSPKTQQRCLIEKMKRTEWLLFLPHPLLHQRWKNISYCSQYGWVSMSTLQNHPFITKWTSARICFKCSSQHSSKIWPTFGALFFEEKSNVGSFVRIHFQFLFFFFELRNSNENPISFFFNQVKRKPLRRALIEGKIRARVLSSSCITGWIIL